MKQFLYKYAEQIFWIYFLLEIFSFFRSILFAYKILVIVDTVFLLLAYYLFKKVKVNRWFLTYFSITAFGFSSYFVFTSTITGN
ncbi:MAG TPA: hypothetical protein VES68_02000, partial [Candidatus Sulfotelmatobacter sp.]|nr:hypothetical protein [Candidatus Sulfotelmatobacter sp.]